MTISGLPPGPNHFSLNTNTPALNEGVLTPSASPSVSRLEKPHSPLATGLHPSAPPPVFLDQNERRLAIWHAVSGTSFSSTGSSIDSQKELPLKPLQKNISLITPAQIAEAAKELGKLRPELKKIETELKKINERIRAHEDTEKYLQQRDKSEKLPTSTEVIKRRGEKFRASRENLLASEQKLLEEINLKTLLLEGRVVENALAKNVDPAKLTYEAVEELIDAEATEEAHSGYERLFTDHPSFKNNGDMGRLEQAATTYGEITRLIKQKEREGGNNAAEEIRLLKFSGLLAKNAVDHLGKALQGNTGIPTIEHKAVLDRVMWVHAEEEKNALMKNHSEKDFRTYLSAIAHACPSAQAAGVLHFGMAGVVMGEIKRAMQSAGHPFDENNTKAVLVMFLANAALLATLFFVMNRTAAPLAKAALEKIPGIRPRPLNATSAEKIIAPEPKTYIDKGRPLDRSSKEIKENEQMVARARKDFEGLTELGTDKGIFGGFVAGKMAGLATVGMVGLQSMNFLPKNAWAGVVAVLGAAFFHHFLQTGFKAKQTINVGEDKIPAYTLGKAEGLEHLYKEFRDIKNSPNEALESFALQFLGTMIATPSSSMLMRSAQQESNPISKYAKSGTAGTLSFAPLMEAATVKASDAVRDGPYAGTETALRKIFTPRDENLPRTVPARSGLVKPSGSEGLNTALRVAEDTKMVANGLQTLGPHIVVDSLGAAAHVVSPSIVALWEKSREMLETAEEAMEKAMSSIPMPSITSGESVNPSQV